MLNICSRSNDLCLILTNELFTRFREIFSCFFVSSSATADKWRKFGPKIAEWVISGASKLLLGDLCLATGDRLDANRPVWRPEQSGYDRHSVGLFVHWRFTYKHGICVAISNKESLKRITGVLSELKNDYQIVIAYVQNSVQWGEGETITEA